MQQPRQLSDVDIGFLKEASANGYDVSFLTGYIDEFNDYQQKWASIVDAAVEQHGPMIRVQLGHDLAKLSEQRGGCSIDDPRVQEIFNYIHKTAMIKQADPAATSQGEAELATPANTTPLIPGTNLTGDESLDAAPTPAAPDPSSMPWGNAGGFNGGQAGWGGGMGGILGLILGQLLFKSPMLGALLGGAGGAGIGGMYGDKIKALLSGLFNNKAAPAAPTNNVEQPGQGTGENDPLPVTPAPSGVVAPADSQNTHELATPEMTSQLPVEGTSETQPDTRMQMPADLADIEKQVVARGAPPAKPPGAAGQSINPIAPAPPVPNPFRGANGQVDPAAVKRTLSGMSVDDTVAAGQRSRMGDVGGRTDMNLNPAASLAPGQVYGAQAAGKPIVPPQPMQMKKGSVLDYWLNKEAYTSSGSNPLMPQQQGQQPMPSPQPQPQQQPQQPGVSPLLPPGTMMGQNPAKIIMPGGQELAPLGMQPSRTVGQQMPQPQPVNKAPQLDFNKQVHPLAI